MKKEDLACVIITSYNHEKYIKEAIESVLLQKTNFSFKVYVADDYSTDKTRDILASYIKKYPNKIKPMYTKKNIGMVKNMENVFNKTQSKYIFILEGDDYWCSPFKMQKQVDLLEENSEYSLIVNRIVVKDKINSKNYFNGNIEDPWSVKNPPIYYLSTQSLIQTQIATNFSSFCFRRESLSQFDKNIFKEKLWDWLFSLLMSTVGIVVYLSEPLSVYRINPSGQWNKKNEKEKKDSFLESISDYNRILNYEYDDDFNKLKLAISHPKNKKIKEMIKLFTPPIILKIFNFFLKITK